MWLKLWGFLCYRKGKTLLIVIFTGLKYLLSVFLCLLSVSLRAQVFTFRGVFTEETQSAKSILRSQCCLWHFSMKRRLDSGGVVCLYCLTASLCFCQDCNLKTSFLVEKNWVPAGGLD